MTHNTQIEAHNIMKSRMMMFRMKLLLSIAAITFDASVNSSKPNETWEVLPNDDTDMNHRKLQVLPDFAPLSCNDSNDPNNNSTDPWDCVPWEEDFGVNEGAIEIPCNKCYSMGNFQGGEIITLSGPLDIKGKLDFPDGTKVQLETTGIIVQGELAMTSTRAVNGIPEISIMFFGSDDVYFTPDPENAGACVSESTSGVIDSRCNLGVKPFVVAGGKLKIDGMTEDCPSWTTVEDFESGALSGKPTPTVFSAQPALPVPSIGTCDAKIIDQDFENGLDSWYGNVGAKEEIMLPNSQDESRYLHISNRNAEFQGPLYDIAADLRECIIPDIDYFFQAKIRISASDGVSSSLCSGTGENCPTIQFGYLDSDDNLRYRDLAEFNSVTFVDNEWHDVKASFRFDASYLTSANVFTALSINGPEAGIDISVDDISINLPPAESYPDTNDVCGDLIQNGDASQSGGFAAPMYSFIKSNSIIVQDEGEGPEFFITNRVAGQDSIAMDLTTGCLEEGSIYTFSMRIKVDSVEKAVPRVILKTHTGGTPVFDIIATCPSSSNDIGWVTCESDFVFSAGHSAAPKVELLIFIKDDISDVHYDDLSFTFHCGVICPMVLTEDPSNCWAPGAEVIFPSETLHLDATTVTTLETVNTGGVITTPSNAVDPAPTAAVDNPHTAGEIGLLSRNIRFSSGDSSVTGPSLVVLRTPNVPQLIRGAEFLGFGDQAVAGRHVSPTFMSCMLNFSKREHSNSTVCYLCFTALLKGHKF